MPKATITRTKPTKAAVRGTKPTKAPKPRKPAKGTGHGNSGPDAAAAVLKANGGRPMRVRDLWTKIEAKGLWKPTGATPWQSLSAAIQRSDRFKRAGRGLWMLK